MPHLNFKDVLPDPAIFLALSPEELAGPLLVMVNSRADQQHSPHNISLEIDGAYAGADTKQLKFAFFEAWNWLLREGLIANTFGPGAGGWAFVTRRGRDIRDREAFDSYRRASKFPKDMLHPKIADKVWLTFLRGEHDTAVFQSFKEVEVAVRESGGYDATDIGVPLMRKAFDKNAGALTDVGSPEGERDALAHLFAGAVGSYKNPHSHRTVAITDPIEAAEMIVLASHLLRIVDARRKNVAKKA